MADRPREMLKIAIGVLIALLALSMVVYGPIHALVGVQDELDRIERAEARMLRVNALVGDYRYRLEKVSTSHGDFYDYRQIWRYDISYPDRNGAIMLDSIEYVVSQRLREPPETAWPVYERGDSVAIYYDPQRENRPTLASAHEAESLGTRSVISITFIIMAVVGLGVTAAGVTFAMRAVRRIYPRTASPGGKDFRR